MNAPKGPRSYRPQRKDAGALTVGFSLGGSLPIRPNPNFLADEQIELNPDLDSWIQIADDGHVTVFTGRVEIGTGILTAPSQIVAEELNVPLATLSLN